MSVLYAPTQGQMERAAARRERLVRLHVVPKPIAVVVSRIEIVHSGPSQPPLSNAMMCKAWMEIDKKVGIDPAPSRIMIGDIQRIVAEFYNVTVGDLKSVRRTANVVRPRQVAMYLAKTLTLHSLPEIGRRFGGRDHTTVLHAVRKIGCLVEKDPRMATEIAELTAIIHSEPHYKAVYQEVLPQ